MNLPNKITTVRIFLSIFILGILLFPFYQINFKFPEYLVADRILVDTKYIIVGVLFLIASLSDFIDGYIARKYNMVTDFGKVMDAVADKILVNGILIMLAYDGFISVLIPVVIITRDIFVDSIKMVVGSKHKAVGASIAGKVKTIFMMTGITLILFYNLPFELLNIRIADLLILIGTVLSIVSGFEYYYKNKNFILEK